MSSPINLQPFYPSIENFEGYFDQIIKQYQFTIQSVSTRSLGPSLGPSLRRSVSRKKNISLVPFNEFEDTLPLSYYVGIISTYYRYPLLGLLYIVFLQYFVTKYSFATHRVFFQKLEMIVIEKASSNTVTNRRIKKRFKLSWRRI